jgi:hypothetical protein
MNKFLWAVGLVGASASALAFAADEMARVISATPVIQQVGVPRQACATYATPGVAPQCSTQTIYESRTVAYNVVYEHAGKLYSVQMPQNPGSTLRLQVAGAQASTTPMPLPAPAPEVGSGNVPSELTEGPALTGQSVGVASPYPPTLVTYAYPGYAWYYGSPYYLPWGPVGVGFVGGYYGGGRFFGSRGGHGHRR